MRLCFHQLHLLAFSYNCVRLEIQIITSILFILSDYILELVFSKLQKIIMINKGNIHISCKCSERQWRSKRKIKIAYEEREKIYGTLRDMFAHTLYLSRSCHWKNIPCLDYGRRLNFVIIWSTKSYSKTCVFLLKTGYISSQVYFQDISRIWSIP